MADFSSLSGYAKGSLVLILLGCLLDVIGFGSPYWISAPGQHQGLWKLCISDICYDLLNARQYLPGWLRATQFFETVGLILIGAAGILLILTILVQMFRDKKIFPILNAILCFAAAGCIFVGVIIYGTQDGFSSYLSWAFALCIVGGILVGVAGVLLIVSAVARG
ncbi:uncharacterized protein LOC121377062 isoform X1 [Gigantopelta aegis]|uniref:uncharacterized protein LOC121377062 isoform X1 n=1 Tax=Gigantopelta aegis TaxID=1735272 RepID=UPI001B88A5F4|nr:uncharacterized protein LOC121377062 isoform X1 [Gigantopelta aegis]